MHHHIVDISHKKVLMSTSVEENNALDVDICRKRNLGWSQLERKKSI